MGLAPFTVGLSDDEGGYYEFDVGVSSPSRTHPACRAAPVKEPNAEGDLRVVDLWGGARVATAEKINKELDGSPTKESLIALQMAARWAGPAAPGIR
jgi:hypothetical protein